MPIPRLQALGKATLTLLLIKVGLWMLPFTAFRWLYDRFARAEGSRIYSEQELGNVTWAVRTAAHILPFRLLCLPQALAVKYLLRHVPDLPLHIGVQHGPDKHFQAHAWVEKDGRPIIGAWPEQISYQPLWVWK